MPKPGQSNAIKDADRLRYRQSYERMKSKNPDLTFEEVGRAVGLKKSSVSKIMNGTQKQSTRKPQLDRYFGVAPEERPAVQRIIGVIVELDEIRQAQLLERAYALLDEQRRG